MVTNGFTMLELMMVLGIISVVMGLAVPSFLSWLPGLRLSNAARQIATDLQLARMRAISQNTATTVNFDVSAGSYTFGSDSRNLGQLFPGVTIASASDPTFTSRGTANAVTITLSNGANQKLVCVKVVGRVTVRDSSCT
jgi:prepilin-type N-terminal cleavage/methylation domain-containing protein